MRLNYLLLLAVISFLISVECVTAKKRRQCKCEPEYHKYYAPDQRKCKRCPKCKPGMGLNQNDQDIKLDPLTNQPLTCYKCSPCPSGQYSDVKAYSCRSCVDCSVVHRLEVRSCNSTSNADCGDCEPMYHDIYKKQTEQMDVTKPCQHCAVADPSLPECAKFISTQSTTHSSSAASSLTQTPSITKSVPRNLHYNQPNQPQLAPAQPLLEKQDGPVFVLPLVITITVFSVVLVGLVVWLKRKPGSTNSGFSSRTPSEISEAGRKEPEVIELDVLSASADSSSVNTRRYDLQEDGVNPTDDVLHPLMNRPELVHCQAPLTSEQKLHIRRIGEKWPHLARVLGLRDADIDYLRQEHRQSQGELIYQMLLKWERMSPSNANLDNAYLGLIQLGETEIASQLYELTTIPRADEQR